MEMFRFTVPLWRWEAQDGWFFVTVPEDVSAIVRERPRPPRGFGSVRVRVRVDGPGPATLWDTSVFPDKSRGCYVLPIKKRVRVVHDLDEGDPVEVELEVLE